jgi:hypothetical protein
VTGTEEAEAEEENQKMYFRPPPKGPEWYAGDAETGLAARPLYPLMLEDPRLRWAFIRKVYSILSIQMLLTVAVAAIVVYVRPVARFFVSTPGGFGLYIFLIILPFIGTRHNLWLDFDLLID